MSRLGDKRIRLTYDDWWGMQSEVAAVTAAMAAVAREVDGVRERCDRKIRALRVEVTAEIDEIRRDHGGRLDALEQARESVIALARRWTEQAEQRRAEIVADGHHERFAPGELDGIVDRFADFTDDAGGHAPDARFTMAWNASHDLAELQARVAERVREWEELRLGCVEGFTALLERWKQEATQTLALPDDGVAVVEVDFWSDGAYADLGERLTAARDALADPETTPDTAALRALLDIELAKHGDELVRLVRAAVETNRHAQVRAEVFGDFYEGMKARGWDMGAMGFADDDERADLLGVITHPSGPKVRIRLPAADDGKQEVLIRFEQARFAALPDRMVALLLKGMQEVADESARGWARADRVEEVEPEPPTPQPRPERE